MNCACMFLENWDRFSDQDMCKIKTLECSRTDAADNSVTGSAGTPLSLFQSCRNEPVIAVSCRCHAGRLYQLSKEPAAASRANLVDNRAGATPHRGTTDSGT